MHARIRRSSSVAAVLFLSLAVPAWLPPPLGLHAQRLPQASDLDRALRANDLLKARLLFSENWDATEQLFVSYLERAFVTRDAVPAQPDARTLAARWAEVHFRVVEYRLRADGHGRSGCG